MSTLNGGEKSLGLILENRIAFRMYCNGLNPNIEMLYNPVSFPVSSGTPPLHTLLSWNHEEEWSVIDLSVLVRINIIHLT